MKTILGIIILSLLSIQSFAESIASFPAGLENWILVKESIIPGKDVELPKETPLFLQNTVKIYNWINGGKGTKLNTYVPKDKLEAFINHGPYDDGPTAVGIFEDSDIIFVTEHLIGEPIYGTYNRKGEDISDTHPTFNTNICIQCHTQNKDICTNGTCFAPIIDIFKK
ncbi:hypothetical protein N9Y67_03510 [Pseudomonadota bacterium]|nr:hypothetical protein [Pseudomonadota bacterium]